MTLHIITCSEDEFAVFKATKDHTYSSLRIQTNEQERKKYTPEFEAQFKKNAWLDFSEIQQDVTENDGTCYYTYSPRHVKVVDELIATCLREKIDTLLIHCAMGLCRSVSIAHAIAQTNVDVTVKNGLYVKTTGIIYPPIIDRHLQFSEYTHP